MKYFFIGFLEALVVGIVLGIVNGFWGNAVPSGGHPSDLLVTTATLAALFLPTIVVSLHLYFLNQKVVIGRASTALGVIGSIIAVVITPIVLLVVMMFGVPVLHFF